MQTRNPLSLGTEKKADNTDISQYNFIVLDWKQTTQEQTITKTQSKNQLLVTNMTQKN